MKEHDQIVFARTQHINDKVTVMKDDGRNLRVYSLAKQVTWKVESV